MGLWDIKFLAILKSLGIIVDLYGRYVDDQLEALPPISPGWDYSTVNKRMEYSAEKAETDLDHPAVRTAKVLQKIANSIEECIQLTFDTPESNAN